MRQSDNERILKTSLYVVSEKKSSLHTKLVQKHRPLLFGNIVFIFRPHIMELWRRKWEKGGRKGVREGVRVDRVWPDL